MLVLAGPAPGAAMSRRLASSSVGRYVRICHNPSDEQLRQLYSDAALLLFPSLYEGFGWPVLEAMACGCPVVCSNTASLPEVVGDLALMAAPDDVEGLAACCARILTDASLSEQMAAKGQQHAAGFSLERFGGQLMEAYGETSSRLAGSG
jgi:glycosyltransferase involved in cell wall biosynthesis